MMINAKLKMKVSVKTLTLIFLLIPFIQARTYSEMPSFIGTGYRLASIIASTIIYFKLIKIKNMGVFKVARLFFLFWGAYLVSTFIFNIGTMAYVLYNAYIHIALVLLLIIEIRKNPQRLLFCLTIIYSALILLNFILRLFFPNGLYQVVSTSYHEAYLLGDGNAVAYVALPCLILSSLFSYVKYKEIKNFVWLICAIVLYNFYLDWSASALVCGVLWVVFLVLISRNIKIPAYAFLIEFIISVFLIFGAPNIAICRNFITNILHKNLTFSGRSVIWASAFEMILQKPILGYGGFFQMGEFTNGVSSRLYPSHTTYLQILIDGGAILFGIFVTIVVEAVMILNKTKNHIESSILISGVFCMMLHYIFEYCGLFHITILLVLAFNIDSIIGDRRKI